MPVQRPVFTYINGTPIYNVWDNDFDVVREGNFLQLFKSQVLDENAVIHDLCIFDCTNEGVGTNDIKVMLDAISTEFPALEVRVLFNIPTTVTTEYKYTCFPGHMVAHCRFVRHVNSLNINWENIIIDRYFMSLQRRASIGRLRFTKKILDTFNKEQYILSCGSQPNEWSSESPNLKEAIHPYKLPILIDGMVDSDTKQHFHTNVDFFKCLINVITETSSQTDDDSWREIFITEKTFKAFAYRQLPVWFAVPGTVQTVRDLGFDVFDDIIDHRYDLEINEDIRMNMVINILSRLCNQYTISELCDLRLGLWKRISNNMQHLNKLEWEHAITKHTHMLELMK